MSKRDTIPKSTSRKFPGPCPCFDGVRWDELDINGKQWPVLADGTDSQIIHQTEFKRGKGRFHFFDWKETKELVENRDDYPYILTTGRILEHYNCGTMTRRTDNALLADKDLLAIHPRDAKKKNIEEGDKVRLYSARGEVLLTARISEEVKPGILYTTFHFPEFMVNNVTSDQHDEESLCPEYKVSSVDFEKASVPTPV